MKTFLGRNALGTARRKRPRFSCLLLPFPLRRLKGRSEVLAPCSPKSFAFAAVPAGRSLLIPDHREQIILTHVTYLPYPRLVLCFIFSDQLPIFSGFKPKRLYHSKSPAPVSTKSKSAADSARNNFNRLGMIRAEIFS